MRMRKGRRVLALVVLPSMSLVGAGVAPAASGGAVVSAGTGVGQMVDSIVASASASEPAPTPHCTIKWRLEYTLYPPNGPINWGWRSTVGCANTDAQALSTRASLYWGSLLVGTTPTATCQDCAGVTSHGFKSIAFNGAGSWSERTADLITVPDIGKDTAKGTIVWSFSNGHGSCTEVVADEVRCTTTSDAVVVP